MKKKMQRNINEQAQKQRRRDAWKSTLFSSLWLLFSGFLLLFLRSKFQIDGFWGAVMGIAAVLELGMNIPVWILLKTRLKEIEGGEEDAAAQY